MTRGRALALTCHAIAAVAVLVSLRLFLTPAADVASVPPQPVRYGLYAVSALSIAVAAGTMLGVFVTGRSWLPVAYLWLLPLVIVALPQIDAGVAGFIFAGFTGHIGAGLALSAAALWIVGCLAGLVLAYRLESRA